MVWCSFRGWAADFQHFLWKNRDVPSAKLHVSKERETMTIKKILHSTWKHLPFLNSVKQILSHAWKKKNISNSFFKLNCRLCNTLKHLATKPRVENYIFNKWDIHPSINLVYISRSRSRLREEWGGRSTGRSGRISSDADAVPFCHGRTNAVGSQMLPIDRSVYVPTLSDGHKRWIVAERYKQQKWTFFAEVLGV